MENSENEENRNSENLEQEIEETTPPISFIRLFRFAQGIEYVLIFFGILAAWMTGAAIPTMNILLGRLGYAFIKYDFESQDDQCTINGTESTNFTNNTELKSNDAGAINYEVRVFGIGMVAIGIFQFIMNYIMVVCLNIAAERQVYRIRGLFLHSLLRQDIAWFDTHQTGGFQISNDLTLLQDGIGEKLGMFFFFLATAVISIIVAFAHGWQLTLIMLCGVPVAIIALTLIKKLQTVVTENEHSAYNSAGGIAEEVLGAIRTVVAFGGEIKEVERYKKKLDHATIAGIRRGMLSGIGGAIVWFIIFASLALVFWYGVIELFLVQRHLIRPTYSSSALIIIYFNVLMGAWYMGTSAPYLETFYQARISAAAVFKIIDRKPLIDSSSNHGLKPSTIKGDIEFDNVFFSYPSRSEVQILNGLSLKIKTGETVALVGQSGCGKSTAIQMMQRFYDPAYGAVRLDGHDIKKLNLGWLRENIGVVGQEPVLFGASISENILYGRSTATIDEVKGSAMEANAHTFIEKLPKKYETYLGDRGTQLSGGQKQRVAIARALIKNPKILLLDEATSALDVESEAVVQDALEKARKGRTTIIIAHRLTTIKNADKIALFSKGKIEELGTHQELMEKKGSYYNFVITQSGGESGETARLASRKMSVCRFNSKQRVSKRESNISFQDNITYNAIDEECTQFASSEEKEFEKSSPTFTKILKENKAEWKYILMGIIGSIGMGFSMPLYAIILGEIMGVLSFCDERDIIDSVNFLLTMMLLTGAFTAAAYFLQTFMFTCSGEYLTKRLRSMTFSAMLKQEISWFDDPRNNVGSLCTRLSDDASNVQGATGSKIGNILHACCTLGAFFIISLFLSWKLALASIATVPIILMAAYLHSKIIMGQSAVEMNALEEANKIVAETIFNIRTVVSLHKEDDFLQVYMEQLEGAHRNALRKTHLRGAIFGLANAMPFFSYAVSICFGGYLIVSEALKYKIVFQISELQMWGTFMVGQAFAFAPNTNRGVVSAARIFKLLERKSRIDSSVESGLKLNKETEGRIEFKNVQFHYPTRPDVPILKGLNLNITAGQTVALVGSSGCGKSTCIQLLERFYDPIIGTVTMDNLDIPQLNVRWLRHQIGIVSQEPTLFQRSIAENIAYGDNSRKVPINEIISAATKANIHNFISSLPQGYDTFLGSHGAQLSGGQKQRIAIARALVRNPKILLLDEATSALDTESEKVVQEALEEAQKGRTCITVAHRLSTIKNANQIAVIHRGKVMELGTHQELLAKEGLYFKFYKIQSNH